ncbi:MAG: hypothetical protein LAQ30_00700 [Acidobacteriia bacterium]|nr:hypothetical protein [Terriglobia bacterium]
MRSKNSLRRFVPACVTISLLGGGAGQAAEQTAKTPAIAVLAGGEAAQWQAWTKDLGWRVIVPDSSAGQGADVHVQAVSAAVQEAIRNSGVDPDRVYLAARSAADVLYTISRTPDLWAAAVAAGGSPQAAIDTNRIFAANFRNTPVLWISQDPGTQDLAGKLKSAGLNLERRSGDVAAGSVLQWLAAHQREEFPLSVDCETNAPAFARCYWIQLTKFDPAERNDVLPTTLIPGSSGAALDLGGFSYKLDDPGPGVLVNLPQKYSGPLKTGDRIVALDGKPVENARQFAETMEKTTEEKSAVAMVQRGAERKRIETRIVLPKRDPVVTARVQGKYVPEDKEIQVITRTVTELRVTVPPQWVPANLYWNGLALEDIKTPGCIALKMNKELLRAERCQ